jgi:uncharacterized protein with FMN-binding domain
VNTRSALTGIFATVTVVIVGWQIGAVALGQGTTSSAVSSAASNPASGLKSGTYTGANEQTRFGDVQVEITVSNGTITDVKAVVLTGNEGRSDQINNQAAPILRSEVLSSQSANVASVSGATYTSDAYLASLQSALDRAKG